MRRNALVFALTCSLIAVLLAAPAKADYKQAVQEYNQGHYDKAMQAIKPDVEQNPDWEPGHRLLGLCYLNLKNYALAVSSFSRAVQLKSQSFSTYLGLGKAYYYMKNYDGCISALNQGEPFSAKDRDADKAALYKFRGSAYFKTNKLGEAIGDLTNALRMNQSDWGDFFMLGSAYLGANRTDEAIQALEKALSMKPGESTTTSLLGKAYLKKGTDSISAKQYPAAMQELLKAKDYDPRNGYVYYNLAEIYLFEKKYPDMEKALSQAIDLMPKSSGLYERLGLAYENQKKWDLALNAYKKADEMGPSKEIKDAITRVTENKKR
jgi:tetratricopeptide (TPR) repeat protein